MDRRRFVSGTAALPLAVGVAGSARAEGSAQLPPGTSVDLHVRMRTRLDGLPCYWFYQGTLFGKIEGEKTVPLLGVEGISRTLCERLANGDYRYQLLEAGYYLDLATGELAGDWRNPLNGTLVQPEPYLSPQDLQFEQSGRVRPTAALPADANIDYTGMITPVQSFAGRAWSSEDLLVRMGGTPGRPVRTATSLATFSADIAQIADTTRPVVDCEFSYHTMGSWRSWLQMGETPGIVSMRLTGQKVSLPEQLPKPLLERITSQYQGFLEGRMK